MSDKYSRHSDSGLFNENPGRYGDFGGNNNGTSGKLITEVCISDSKGRITYASPRLYEILGAKKTNLIGERLSDLITGWPESDISDMLTNTNADPVSVKLKNSETPAESCIIKKVQPASENSSHILYEIEGIVLEGKKQKQSFYKDLLEKLPAEVSVIDQDFRYLYVNPETIENETLREWLYGRNDLEYATFWGRDKLLAENRIKKYKEAVKSKRPVEWVEEVTSGSKKQVKHFLRRSIPVFEEDQLLMLICFGKEVTDKVNLENEIKNLSLVASNISGSVLILDEELRISWVNNAFSGYFGYNKSEVIGRMFGNLLKKSMVPVSQYEDILCQLQRSKSIKRELFYYSKSGTPRWAALMINPVYKSDGSISFIVVANDITEFKETQQKLSRSEYILKTINRSSRILISEPDSQTAVNKALETIGRTFYTERVLLVQFSGTDARKPFNNPIVYRWDNSSEDLSHVDDIPAKWLEMLERGQVVNKDITDASIEECRWLKEKEIVSTLLLPVYLGNTFSGYLRIDQKYYMFDFTPADESSLLNFAIILGGILQRNDLEQNLSNKRDFVQSVIEYNPNPVYIADDNGVVTLANAAFSRLFGVDTEKIRGKTEAELLPDISKENRAFRENRRVIKVSKPLLDIEGKVYNPKSEDHEWYQFIKVPIKGEKGESLVLCIANNIDIHKRTQERLLKAKREAEESDKAKDTFLANISHEVRTPMNGIVGMANMLSKTSLEPKQKEFIDIIRKSSETLLVIINDILDFSKIRSNKIELESVPFCINENISSVVSLLKPKAEEKGLTFEFEVPVTDANIVHGDPYRLNQILFNLISNAIKFTNNGSIALKAKPEKHSSNAVLWRFSIKDTGVGINTDNKEKVFQEFHQAGADTSHKMEGTGLGLSISKKLTELQGGNLDFESTPGQGSEFYFTIPYRLSDTEELEGIQQKKQVRTDFSELEGKKILLAEDNEVNRLLVTSLLSHKGVIVTNVDNGQKALDKLEHEKFDLVLMDIQMPVMNGTEAVKYIRKNPDPDIARVPVIALTADAIKGSAKRYIKLGMDDYLSKPFEENDLLTRVVENLKKF